jgi:hypothetical protein
MVQIKEEQAALAQQVAEAEEQLRAAALIQVRGNVWLLTYKAVSNRNAERQG